MHLSTRICLAVVACTILLSQTSRSNGYVIQRQRIQDSDPALAAALLKEILDEIRSQELQKPADKRRYDSGYGSRYRVAQNVGSKLLALKQAADWNGPGRKKRDTN